VVEIASSIASEDKIVLTDNNNNEIAHITPSESDFKNLKSDGNKVLTAESGAELIDEECVIYETNNGEKVARVSRRGIEAKDFILNGASIGDLVEGYEKKQPLKIMIPDIVYAIEGVETNLYNDTVAISSDRGVASPLNYYTVWTCLKGRITEKGFRFTPTASDVGEHSCKCSIFTLGGELLDEKTFTIKVASKNALAASKRILFCGDSIGAGTANRIYNDFHSESFEGVAPEMVGGVAGSPHSLSYGGWKWSMYSSAGEVKFRCQVSGITSLQLLAKYVDENNGLFQIEEINLTDGTGNILVGRVYAAGYDYHALPASGVLTKIAGWGGDNSFSYTSQPEDGNPLWNSATASLDIANYRSKIGLGANEKIDLVMFQLGGNDVAGIEYDQKGVRLKTNILTVYNAFMADNPNCLFVLGHDPVGCNTAGGFGSNYGCFDISTFKKYYKVVMDIYTELNDNKSAYPNIRLANENFCIDRYYGYPLQEVPINADSSITESVHVNALHPNGEGYSQIGDSAFAAIVNILS